MGALNIVIILFLLVAIAIAIACVIVIVGNRPKAQSGLDEVHLGDTRIDQEKQVANSVLEEDGGLQGEIEFSQPVEEPAIEASGDIEDKHQQFKDAELIETEHLKANSNGGYHKSNELQEIEGIIRPKEELQQWEKEEVQNKEETANKRWSPDKRGGRPRSLTEEQEKPKTQESKHRLKPEIICWKKDRQWVVGVEVPEEFRNYPDLAILQNGSALEQDKSREACWQLKLAFGTIVVSWDEGGDVQDIKIVLDQQGYLLFKLSGQNQNEGRRVKSPSLGWHLVITPGDWNRDEELSGPPLIAPESAAFQGYRAHFFINEKDEESKIAFLTPTGETVIVKTKASKFDLIGTRLNDAAQNIGPLFGQKPPKISVEDREVWKDVGTIVVGEEGGGKGRWRKAFYPVPENKEQDLPFEITDKKAGWYFLRFYDTDDDLIESLDFRVVIPLHEIRIDQSSPFPSDDGHESAHIELHHESNFTIQPADNIAQEIQIEKKDRRTVLTIPPIHTYDETRWLIGFGRGQQVQATFLVERIWWAIDKEEISPSDWGDNLLTLQHDDFNATSNRALWIRFPRSRWVNRIMVGFEHVRARPYQVKVTEREIAIPLREFGDCKELSEQDRDHFLNIWIERDDQFIEENVAILPASRGAILYIGWGRKKRATAAAVLREGHGVIKVNGRVLNEYFANSPFKARQFMQRLLELPEISQLLNRMEVFIEVKGSSPNTIQQVKASTHALAHALMRYDPDLIQLLERSGFGGVKVTERFGIQSGK